MYDRYGQWVPDNSGIDTSPDGVDGGDCMNPEDVDTSSMLPDDLGPQTKD
jgi:hypothetical protein